LDASKIILITGGIKSGKSRFALQRAKECHGQKTMIATAMAFDKQMRIKIQKHQQERGTEFKTIEEPIYLADTIKIAQAGSVIILVDCVTMWLNNLYHRFPENLEDIENQINKFIEALSHSMTPIIIITNEVGLGILPDNKLACRYADELGKLNQRMAAISDEVVMLISGIPQWVKGLPAGRQGVNIHGQMDREIKTY